MTDEFRDTLDGEDVFHRFLAGISGIAPRPDTTSDDFIIHECPYLGLQEFDMEHDATFLRQRCVIRMVVESHCSSRVLFASNI